jgi:2-keto-4-pentenoate hydratase/2-oxohepta-3-ene-1,7-dioic acid hydratase in catechol pathway
MRNDVVASTGYLQPGDEVVCEIELIGSLRNRVAAA